MDGGGRLLLSHRAGRSDPATVLTTGKADGRQGDHGTGDLVSDRWQHVHGSRWTGGLHVATVQKFAVQNLEGLAVPAGFSPEGLPP